jgi:hypothetical protein
MKWNEVGYYYVPLFGFAKKRWNGMKWSVMECIPSNTTHSCNFPFPPIWGVCDGMVHNNYSFTILPSILYFIKRLFSFLIILSHVSSSLRLCLLLLQQLFTTVCFSLCFLLFYNSSLLLLRQGKALTFLHVCLFLCPKN